jgi:hypothetical protein
LFLGKRAKKGVVWAVLGQNNGNFGIQFFEENPSQRISYILTNDISYGNIANNDISFSDTAKADIRSRDG